MGVISSTSPERDLVTFLTSYPEEMAFGDAEPGEILDRYFTADFEYYNDGVLLDRERLIAHVRPVRTNVVGVRVDVHEALVSGDRIAARYTLHADTRKSGVLVTEVCMFGHLALDGRIHRVDQITRIVPEA
jgi:hypothetical protein